MVPGVALPVFQILAADCAALGAGWSHAAYSLRLNSRPSVLASTRSTNYEHISGLANRSCPPSVKGASEPRFAHGFCQMPIFDEDSRRDARRSIRTRRYSGRLLPESSNEVAHRLVPSSPRGALILEKSLPKTR